jgi:dynein heavy chain
MTNKVKALGQIPDRSNCWEFYLSEIRRNLHVVLAFSPVGDAFRTRARLYIYTYVYVSVLWINKYLYTWLTYVCIYIQIYVYIHIYRKFPAIVNCTVIDWFQPWPHEALFSVGKRFMANVDLGMDAYMHIFINVYKYINMYL